MRSVTAREIAETLKSSPRKLPVVVNGRAVQAVVVAHGRIRRDLMDTSFTEMPDKPRDAALVIRFGDGEPMKVAEVQAALEAHGDLEVFVWGTQVSAIRHLKAYYDRGQGRYVFSSGTRSMVASPLHWTEQSDGEQVETHVWTPPLPTPSYT